MLNLILDIKKEFIFMNSSLTWSGRRDSNPRPPPWQGDVLPLNYFRDTKSIIAKIILFANTF